MFEVDRNAALAAIQPEKETRDAAGERRAPAATHIAAARFQLVHLGAVIAEQQRAIGARERVRKVEHADAVERTLVQECTSMFPMRKTNRGKGGLSPGSRSRNSPFGSGCGESIAGVPPTRDSPKL